VFVDGSATGMRLVRSFGSRLSILVLPFAEIARLKERLSPWDYVVYVIDDPLPMSDQRTYIGHGDGERDFGDRLGDAISATTQIYVIIADGDTFDKVTAPYVRIELRTLMSSKLRYNFSPLSLRACLLAPAKPPSGPTLRLPKRLSFSESNALT
jgi:hypothetical protein